MDENRKLDSRKIDKKRAPYGTWHSPLSAEQVVAASAKRSEPKYQDGAVVWVESRADTKGKKVLVRQGRSGAQTDIVSAPYAVRSRVHEYGGGSWWAGAGCLYFCNEEDARIYRLEDEDPYPVTQESGTWRYADGCEHPDGKWFVCIREDHTGDGEPENTIVAFCSSSEEPRVLISGSDFFSAPRFSPDGAWLSWVEWDHPEMPWDAARVVVVRVENMDVVEESRQVVAGASRSAPQTPDWLRSGELAFADDTSGFWNLYRWNPETDVVETIIALADSDVGYPPWVFGLQRWAEQPDGTILAIATCEGVDRVLTLQCGGDTVRELDLPFCDISSVSAGEGKEFFLLAATRKSSPELVSVNLDTGTYSALLERDHQIDGTSEKAVCFSEPVSYAFPSADGNDSHCFFYPPSSSTFVGRGGEKPPLIVMGHGGPTAHASPALKLRTQFWTSRGFAVVDVNYAGSSGFGRAYRSRLEKSWGVLDVSDCVQAAEMLIEKGLVDKDRVVIRGSSASGLTTLMALASSSIFAAGVSLYGVTDLTSLAADTHKFESRYFDSLVGMYPEEKSVYIDRSPISHVKNISAPLLIMQGTEDAVVPPSQAEMLVTALKENGVDTTYIPFEGEGHGFRKPENAVRALTAELSFYSRVLGF